MFRTFATALAATLALPSGSAAHQDSRRAEWNRPMAPFRVIGNVYSVGTAGIASYLVTSARGHILIDGAMRASVPQIVANIRALGFRPEDVRVLLINHAHWDHAEGLAELKRLTGARLLASAADKPGLEAGRLAYRPDLDSFPPVKVDGVLRDGAHVRVGTTDLVTHLTPGHTKGCTSWTTRVRAGGRERTVLFACSISVAGQPLVPGKGYDGAAADFRATFARLRTTEADVFLGFHPFTFGMEEKRRKLAAGDADAFVDPAELERQVDAAEKAFNAELKRQRAAQ